MTEGEVLINNNELWRRYTSYYPVHEEIVDKFNTLCGNISSNNELYSMENINRLRVLYEALCKEEAQEALAAYKLEDIHGNTISEGQALNDLVDAACDLFYVGSFYKGLFIHNCTNSGFFQPHTAIGKLLMWCSNPEKHPSDCPYQTGVFFLEKLKVDPDDALNKVHESNFSKFMDVTGIPLEDVAEIAETEIEEIKQAYKAKGKPLKEVTYQVNPYNDESWLTFYNENGKVLKPSGFFEPDFTDVVKHLL